MDSNIHFTEMEKSILNRIHYYISKKERVKIDQIAQDCFVSKGAIVKLAKKLGYSGYSELYYVTFATMNNISGENYIDINTLVNNYELSSNVSKFTDLIYMFKDKRIKIDSLGFCDSAKDYYIQKLQTFGFSSMSCYHFSSFSKENSGVYIFMSYSGTRSEILEKVNVAKENGDYVVALTNNANSPLAKVSHMVIEVNGIQSENKNYQPNLFTANLIILLEMALSNYSKKYIREL